MARSSILLLTLVSLTVASAGQLKTAQGAAQTGPFKHIIIVVQENRTPDNLFGSPPRSHCNERNPFLAGADLVGGGMGYVPQSDGSHKYQLICNTSQPLNGWVQSAGKVIDADHTYGGWDKDYLGWDGTGYSDNLMSGFCHIYNYKLWSGLCPAYSYVQKSDVQPYHDIASNYGFANYMFQSHEGGSLPPHLFLFTGTSAPVSPTGDNCEYGNWSCAYDFIGDDLYPQPKPAGCAYDGSSGSPPWVEPDGTFIHDPRQNQSECYTHDSLVTDAADCTNQKDGTDYCDRAVNGQSSTSGWAYYVEPSSKGVSNWDVPAFFPEVCYGQTEQWGIGNPCGTGPSGKSTEWSDHMRFPHGAVPYAPSQTYSWSPILDDILACHLAAISWVVPDWAYSDVPNGLVPTAVSIGPSWVANIVDLIGKSYQLTNQKCDYWGVGTGSSNPEPTAIFVVWDDWGGFYDHVAPFVARRDGGGTGFTDCNPDNGQWGCGYTEGFRVPLMVVSPYTAPYVSGACGKGTHTGCPNFGKDPSYNFGQYTHDFGSILAYTEWNFGLPNIDQIKYGYADWNAPDWSTDHKSHVPLSDFFGSTGRSFTNIKTPYDYKCFQTHTKSKTCPVDDTWVARDPDDY